MVENTRAAELVLIVECNQSAMVTVSSSNVIETEEYAVYSAVIQALYLNNPKHNLIVINEQTEIDYGPRDLSKTLDGLHQDLPDLTVDTIANFKIKNQRPQILKRLLNISVDYVFISQQELNTIFQRVEGWSDFYAKYPNSQGEMILSQVSFNSQKNIALVYVGNQSGWLSGSGYYIMLKKVNGIWVIQGQVMAWIS